MYVELLEFSSGKAQVMATVRVSKGRVVIDPPVPQAIADEITQVHADAPSPAMFLRQLPRVFSGSYLRAKLVRENPSAETALKFNPNHDEQGRFATGLGGWYDKSKIREGKAKRFQAERHGKLVPPPASVLQSMGTPDGGFTYSPTTGKQPKTGFALSIHPEREQVVDVADANVVALAKYAVKNWDLLKEEGNYIGGWHHPRNGKVYLDVSTVVDNEHEAARMALEAKQVAYFDLVRGMSVKVGERED